MDAPTTDRACFDLMVNTFKALNLFNQVSFGPRPLQGQDFPCVWIQPWKWSEADDDDFGVRLRTIWFRLNIDVQTRDTGYDPDPFDQIQGLTASLSNAIDQIVGAPWLSGESRLSEGLYPFDTAKSPRPNHYPVTSATAIGKLVYEVTAGGRMVDDN